MSVELVFKVGCDLCGGYAAYSTVPNGNIRGFLPFGFRQYSFGWNDLECSLFLCDTCSDVLKQANIFANLDPNKPEQEGIAWLEFLEKHLGTTIAISTLVTNSHENP
jgi:hypothetical protein